VLYPSGKTLHKSEKVTVNGLKPSKYLKPEKDCHKLGWKTKKESPKKNQTDRKK